MEWTPPPDGIAVCQGGGVTNPRRRIIGMDASHPLACPRLVVQRLS